MAYYVWSSRDENVTQITKTTSTTGNGFAFRADLPVRWRLPGGGRLPKRQQDGKIWKTINGCLLSGGRGTWVCLAKCGTRSMCVHGNTKIDMYPKRRKIYTALQKKPDDGRMSRAFYYGTKHFIIEPPRPCSVHASLLCGQGA